MTTVKTNEDLELIKKALKNYLSSRNGEDPRYTKHGDRWFGSWREWVDYTPLAPARKGSGVPASGEDLERARRVSQ